MSRRAKKDFVLFHNDKDGHLLIRRQQLSIGYAKLLRIYDG